MAKYCPQYIPLAALVLISFLFLFPGSGQAASPPALRNGPFFTAWADVAQESPIPTQYWGMAASQYRQISSDAAAAAAFAAANPGKLYVFGDEPDQDCSTNPWAYAAAYHDFVVTVRAADPTARFSPAGFAEPNSQCCDDDPCQSANHYIGYAQQFYDAYIAQFGTAPPVDEWRFHNFGLNSWGWGTSTFLTVWSSQVDQAATWSVNHGAPMVLGSWGFIGIYWVPMGDSYFLAQMREAMRILQANPRISSAAYWSLQDTGSPHYLKYSDGSLTPEGDTYRGCGEYGCDAVQGQYISHFTGSYCDGTESYYTPYGIGRRSWDGRGVVGKTLRTVTNRSNKTSDGVCHANAWPNGNTLSGFVTVYETQPVCREVACVALGGSYISHFTGANCDGTESYYTPYFGSDGVRRSWNGKGIAGTIIYTLTNRSYRTSDGVCHANAWPYGNTLWGFVKVYRR